MQEDNVLSVKAFLKPFYRDDVFKEMLTTQIEMFNPIQTGFFFWFQLPKGDLWSSPISNFKTAHSTATKITFHS